MSEPKTFAAAGEELREAWCHLVVVVIEESGLARLLDWLTAAVRWLGDREPRA